MDFNFKTWGVSEMGVQNLISAGGVVYRIGEKGIEVVICGRIDPGIWSLPKGTPNERELIEDTAIREVGEETGLKVTIEGSLGSIEYEFEDRSLGVNYRKRVYYYLMTKIGGSFSLHDEEFDEVRWMPIRESVKIMTYENESAVLRRAILRLSQDGS